MVFCSICKEPNHNKKTCHLKHNDPDVITDYIETRMMIRGDFNNAIQYGTIKMRDDFMLYMKCHRDLGRYGRHEVYLKTRMRDLHQRLLECDHIDTNKQNAKAYGLVTKNLIALREKQYPVMRALLRSVNKRIKTEYIMLLFDVMCNRKNTIYFRQIEPPLDFWVNTHINRTHLPIDCCRYIFGFLLPRN